MWGTHTGENRSSYPFCSVIYFVPMARTSRTKGTYSYQIVLRPEPEGGYTVIVPALPGCVTYGRTVEEANVMAEDAVRGYLESIKKEGKRIPKEDRSNIFATTTVSV
jgi:antitoxin HicB